MPHLVSDLGHEVTNASTYAASFSLLNPIATRSSRRISDAGKVTAVFARHQLDAVMHLAAESHVDRSWEKGRT